MKRTRLLFIRSGLATALILGSIHTMSLAQEPANVADLRKQIEALQKRVDQLEAEKNNAQPAARQLFKSGPVQAWDPFDEINRMQEDMDHMLQNSLGRSGGKSGLFSSNMSFQPDFDLKETADGYEIRFDMQGFDKDKVDIQINEHSITVKGEQARQEKTNGPAQSLSSQSFGAFVRTIPVPTDADTAKVKTDKEGDTLVIRLPKKTK